MNAETKNCQNCKNNFTIESEDFSFYQKIGVPAPTWCPNCRFVRKLTFINHRSLYRRACSRCNEFTISMYHPDVPLPVWCIKCYISDTWDAREYAKEYDFSKTFFEQYKDLKYSVPHRALDQNERNGGGCEYANYCYTSKNIYLSYDVGKSEEIKYSSYVFADNKNCLDSLFIKENDRCYEVVQTSGSYNSSFLIESSQCVDSHFLYDSHNCVNCCLSSNLRNKSYVFRNQQLSKDEYKKAVSALLLDTYSGQVRAKQEFFDLAKNAIHKYAHIKNSVQATGDFIDNSKNVHHCYGLVDAENSKYIFMGANTTKDSYDLVGTGKLEECYEATYAGRGGSKIILSLSCGGGSRNLFYCDSSRGCSDCFGCVGLNKKQYCILNKQYSKEEYYEMIEKIKNQMDDVVYTDSVGRIYPYGEFFPTEISPFTYNETIAFEENFINKEKIISSGYTWRDIEKKSYIPTTTSDALPENIHDVSDSICNEIIECPNKSNAESQCSSAYRILPDELQFYKQMNLPLPRLCPNCRFTERLAWKNPFKFYRRRCACDVGGHGHDDNCQNEFETMYKDTAPEKVYCESCYQKEVI